MIRKKHLFVFGKLHAWKSRTGLFCVILALAEGGCGKQNTSTVATPSSPSGSNSVIAESSVPPPQNRIQSSPPSVSSNNAGPTQLQSLNRALLGWKIKNHKQPGTFQEFASSAGFQIPDPPPGKKYSLSSGFIVLVNANQ